ncbi:MAG: sulfotransferase [Nocardioidaceae bacterium]
MADTTGGADVRVLVIGGWGRCGSTLLDMLLGQLDGFVSAGEIRELWLRGCVEDRPCGCGEKFSSCPFWTEVGERAYGGWDRLDLETVMRVRYGWDRVWGMPRLVWSRDHGSHSADLAVYTDALRRLLAAISAASGGSVVIDSSKLPTHTVMLQQLPGLDLRMLHLVRDSRGVAYSNQKHENKVATDDGSTTPPRYGASTSALRYDLYNGLTSALGRNADLPYLRLRYEDLTADPERRIREILRHAGVDADRDLPYLHEGSADLRPNHLVDGNPVRFAKGPVRIRLDDEWQRSLSRRDRRTVTALTLPLLRAYDY